MSESKRARWRAHVVAQEGSGLSGAAYCREHGLAPGSFYYWRGVLREAGALEGVVSGDLRCGQAGAQTGAQARALFAEVRVAGGALRASPAASSSGVEVCLGDGRFVRVGQGFDAETLRRVVAVLEGQAC